MTEAARSAPHMNGNPADSETENIEDSTVVLRVQCLSARDIKVDRSFMIDWCMLHDSL